MSTFIQRMTTDIKFPEQPLLPWKPPHDPAFVVRGPDVPRRYGSWRTEVCTKCGAWRKHGHTSTTADDQMASWTPCDDYTEIENVIGLRVILSRGSSRGLSGVALGTDYEGFIVLQMSNETCRYGLIPDDVLVVDDPNYKNRFQRLIADRFFDETGAEL